MRRTLSILLLLASRTLSVFGEWNVSASSWSGFKVSANVKPYEPVPIIRDWSYELHSLKGPLYWHRQYPECNFRKQSPINVPEFPYNGFCDLPVQLKFISKSDDIDGELMNNGVQIYFKIPREKWPDAPRLSATFLDAEFFLEKVIFHWANTSLEGSEHAINNERLPFEIQLFFRPRRPKLGRADQRYAVSILGHRTSVDNANLDTLINTATSGVREPGDSQPLKISLSSLLPSSSNRDFYLYHGSLPHPPCAEDVTWLIFKEQIAISESQLRTLRSLSKKTRGIHNNFRPIQPLMDREIFGSCLAPMGRFSGAPTAQSDQGVTKLMPLSSLIDGPTTNKRNEPWAMTTTQASSRNARYNPRDPAPGGKGNSLECVFQCIFMLELVAIFEFILLYICWDIHL